VFKHRAQWFYARYFCQSGDYPRWTRRASPELAKRRRMDANFARKIVLRSLPPRFFY